MGASLSDRLARQSTRGGWLDAIRHGGCVALVGCFSAACCMALEQTDDVEQAGVQRCVSRPEPSAIRHATACGKNEYWKRMICRATPRRNDVEGCVGDRAFIPTIVARGAGGSER